MLPAEKLRLLIEKHYNINLSKYAWNDELKNNIFSIPLDKTLEEKANTLKDVYLHGFNIGHCGLTSRYVIQKYNDASLNYGICKLLIGTKSALNGSHAWVEYNGYLIDTTLMLCIPLDDKEKLGYETTKVIDKDSATMLSEYELYDHDFYDLEHNTQFMENLYSIKK